MGLGHGSIYAIDLIWALGIRNQILVYMAKGMNSPIYNGNATAILHDMNWVHFVIACNVNSHLTLM